MKRREYIKSSIASSVAISMPLFLSANIEGANDRVRVGFVGIHGIRQAHIHAYSELKNVEVAAIWVIQASKHVSVEKPFC